MMTGTLAPIYKIADDATFTPYYLPKVRESVFVKHHHVNAFGSFRNSFKESYGSNDMAHNYYLEKAKKKTEEINRSSKPSVMHATSLQNTTKGSKQKLRSNNQTTRSLPVSKSSYGMSNGVPLVDYFRNSNSFSDSKHFVCSTCQKCVFNANHDACLTKFLKDVNSRIKVQSLKTRNNIKPVEKITNVIKPKIWIYKGYRFSPNKSSAVHEKPNTSRSCLRWKSTGRIFKNVGLRWRPAGKIPLQPPITTTKKHQSDTKVITMTMEILLEPTSSKLLVGRSLQTQRLIQSHGQMTKPYSSPRFIANCFIEDSHKGGHRGTKVGGNMSRVEAWTEIVDK
nr:hypothetical protein [Tanacetum cinerariifolium]